LCLDEANIDTRRPSTRGPRPFMATAKGLCSFKAEEGEKDE